MLGHQHSWYPHGYIRSFLTTRCHYAMLFTLSSFLCSPPSMSPSPVLSQSFCCVHSKTPFSLKFVQPNYFSPSACINLIIYLVTFFHLSFDNFLSYLFSIPFLSQVHCCGHASSLPARHRTELMSTCGPHDHRCLGAVLCCVLPSPLWLQHHR